jgi:PII-like signaling protein
MNNRSKMMLIFLDENDRWGDPARPLYEAIVHRLMQLGVAGATAHVGVIGFGANRRLHRKGLFGVPDDRPVTIAAVDDEAKLRAAAGQVGQMVAEGLILLVDGEILHRGIRPVGDDGGGGD